jgi:hypothetical protein
MFTHVEKEEMGLLPIMEESIDATAEATLFQVHVEERTG